MPTWNWGELVTFGIIWIHLAYFGIIWHQLDSIGNIMSYHVLSFHIWSQVKTSNLLFCHIQANLATSKRCCCAVSRAKLPWYCSFVAQEFSTAAESLACLMKVAVRLGHFKLSCFGCNGFIFVHQGLRIVLFIKDWVKWSSLLSGTT